MKKMVLTAMFFQILVLISFVFCAYVPLCFGDEIKIKATGFDPRDIFLGNYVGLNYPSITDIEFSEDFGRHEKIFVVLQKDGDIYKGKFATKERLKKRDLFKW